MGLITERDSAARGYASVTIPGARLVADGPRGSGCGIDSSGAGGSGPGPGGTGSAGGPGSNGTEAATGGEAVLHRRSALPSRRAVLYLLCRQDAFAAEDLVTWYTARGFHFYVADLRPPDRLDQADGQGRRAPRLAECFTRLDSACRQLREAGGIDMIIVSAHSAGALTAALWCDARRDEGLADALILCRPVTGRRLRRGLDIACPVLVLSEGRQARGSRLAVGPRRRDDGAIRLGPHVTWLQLGPEPARDGEGGGGGGDRAGGADRGSGGDGGGGGAGADAGRRRFFDELGRWLGAYMYVRDQLL